jgi:hypothetical protein
LDSSAKVELFEKIRREYEVGVGTIQGVARKLGVHRRMVRDAIRNAIPAQRQKIDREPTRLVREGVLFIHSVLEQDQQAPRKQRHTAQRVAAAKCPVKRKTGEKMGWVSSFENLQSGRRRRHHCGRQHDQQR